MALGLGSGWVGGCSAKVAARAAWSCGGFWMGTVRGGGKGASGLGRWREGGSGVGIWGYGFGALVGLVGKWFEWVLGRRGVGVGVEGFAVEYVCCALELSFAYVRK